MSIYHPESWQLLKITTENEVLYKVFGGWSDAWRINSGIASYVLEGDIIHFFGNSSSLYVVHKKSEGVRSSYSLNILNQMLAEAEEGGYNVQMISFDDFVLEFSNKDDK